LSHVVFADEGMEEDIAVEQAVACLQSLKALDPKAELADLRIRIQSAERNGDMQEAIRLIEELDRKSRS